MNIINNDNHTGVEGLHNWSSQIQYQHYLIKYVDGP